MAKFYTLITKGVGGSKKAPKLIKLYFFGPKIETRSFFSFSRYGETEVD